MVKSSIGGIAPFFIVQNIAAAKAFYCGMLGFEVIFQEPDNEPFFAIIQRDGAMIFIKAVGQPPLPNHKRHPDARWDAYINVPMPDTLAQEFSLRGVAFAVPIQDTHDGLRGFELEDADGYVLFFGRPR